jgi:glycosyltransferase involved in cell wall biosynthesis
MPPRKRILVFIDWFLPGYKAGGQIPSVARIINLLHEKNDFFLVTRNSDLNEKEGYLSIETDKWIQSYGITIKYLENKSMKLSVIRGIIKEVNPEIIYCNSMFSIPFTLFPLIINRIFYPSIKFFLAPRGMLGSGALQQKVLKKRLFLFITKSLNIFKNIHWHASSAWEKDEIENIFGKNSEVHVAMDLSSLPELPAGSSKDPKKSGEASLFFLSRISPKKNLQFVLDLFKLYTITGIIKFHIIGPIEDIAYWNACKKTISTFPENITVDYLGSLRPSDCTQFIFKHCQFMILPTLHENYGHVIFESFSLGCPVIISDRTPWKNLQSPESQITNHKSKLTNLQSETHSVGWDIPLEEPGQFVKVIELCARMDQEEFNIMSQNAFNFAKQIAEDPAILDANRKLFE